MQFRSALYEWKHETASSGEEKGGDAGDGEAGRGVASTPPPEGTDGKDPVGSGGSGSSGSISSKGGEREEEEAEDPSECIPLQLQRLFGQLQLSDKACVETRALTDSFGWTAQASDWGGGRRGGRVVVQLLVVKTFAGPACALWGHRDGSEGGGGGYMIDLILGCCFQGVEEGMFRPGGCRACFYGSRVEVWLSYCASLGCRGHSWP